MKLSWKAPTLLAAILLVALGLQTSAIKILLDLSQSPEPDPVAREPGAASPSPVAPPVPTATQEAERWPAIDPPPPEARDPVILTDSPHLADLAVEARPAVTEVSPPDPVPAPVPDAAALAMVKLAELAEQTAAAPAQPALPEPMPAERAAPESTPAKPAPVAVLQDAAWLKARDPRRYTIQLVSGKDLGRLKEAAATMGSAEPQAYYTTGSRTSPWYSLVLGDYPDVTAARATAAKLSASSALKPWVRRFADIQSSIR